MTVMTPRRKTKTFACVAESFLLWWRDRWLVKWLKKRKIGKDKLIKKKNKKKITFCHLK